VPQADPVVRVSLDLQGRMVLLERRVRLAALVRRAMLAGLGQLVCRATLGPRAFVVQVGRLVTPAVLARPVDLAPLALLEPAGRKGLQETRGLLGRRGPLAHRALPGTLVYQEWPGLQVVWDSPVPQGRLDHRELRVWSVVLGRRVAPGLQGPVVRAA